MASAAREVAPRSAVARLAWALCLLSILLAVAALALAAFNGLNLLELIADHHAIGIMDGLVLSPIGALIVVGDRRHLLAWLLLVDGRLAWLLLVDGRLPSRRWWPLGLAGVAAMTVPTVVLAVGTWPLRGPELVPQGGEEHDLVSAVFGVTLLTSLVLAAISVVALVLRFRRAGAVQRQQIKWFAYGAAPSVPLGIFAQARPYGPYLEFLGAALQLAGLGIGIFRFRLWDIDRLVNRTLVYGVLTVLLGAVYAGLVLALGQLSGGIGGRTPSWAVAMATLAVATLFQPARRRVQQAVDHTMRPTTTSLWLRPSAAAPAPASPPART